MKFICLFLVTSGILGGCTSSDLFSPSNIDQNIFNELPQENTKAYIDSNTIDINSNYANNNFQTANTPHRNLTNTKNINDYVRGIMQDLVGNMQYVSSATPLAITSFVMLDGDLDTGNLLGNQITESFINEVHKFGIPVIDVKASNAIRITPTGDFLLSRDISELSTDLPVLYALVGTLVKHQEGYLINARIIAIESKAVVATAQGLIPASISNALENSKLYMNDGIVLSNQ